MFNENYALFTSYDGLTFQPNPSSGLLLLLLLLLFFFLTTTITIIITTIMITGIDQNHLSYFRFIGRVVGKAILDNQLLGY